MSALDRLLGIMRTLRDPQRGCPWDREQTFASIAPYTLEETYEVLDAIQREDFEDLRGELGDLLFQVVFYAQMASEQQRFDFDDICNAIQKRCHNVGFDWTSIGPVLDKVHEEIDEVMHEAQQATIDPHKLEEEIGDLLFATVNLSRHLGSKAETALQKANDKFERRFRAVEAIIAAQGLAMPDATLEQMEAAWQQVKQGEKR